MATRHFSDDELKCKCGCDQADMDAGFMARLERVRVAFGAPMRLSSAFRCEAHNEAVGGVDSSPHTLGHAVDVLIEGADALRLIDHARYCGMTGIGVHQKGIRGARFIHLDDLPFTPSQPRPWIWSY